MAESESPGGVEMILKKMAAGDWRKKLKVEPCSGLTQKEFHGFMGKAIPADGFQKPKYS